MLQNRINLKVLLIMLILLLSIGCAVSNKDNRRLLNVLDKQVKPDSTVSKVTLAPVMIPVVTVALAADIVVVHPVSVIPKAADDVYELYWKPRDIDLFRKTLLFVPIVIATPPTFVGDWLGRSLFDID